MGVKCLTGFMKKQNLYQSINIRDEIKEQRR